MKTWNLRCVKLVKFQFCRKQSGEKRAQLLWVSLFRRPLESCIRKKWEFSKFETRVSLSSSTLNPLKIRVDEPLGREIMFPFSEFHLFRCSRVKYQSITCGPSLVLAQAFKHTPLGGSSHGCCFDVPLEFLLSVCSLSDIRSVVRFSQLFLCVYLSDTISVFSEIIQN